MADTHQHTHHHEGSPATDTGSEPLAVPLLLDNDYLDELIFDFLRHNSRNESTTEDQDMLLCSEDHQDHHLNSILSPSRGEQMLQLISPSRSESTGEPGTPTSTSPSLPSTLNAATASRALRNPAKYSLQCQACDKTFPFASKLKRHEVVHTKFKPFSCKFCRKRFSQQCSVTEHVATLHPKDGARSQWECCLNE